MFGKKPGAKKESGIVPARDIKASATFIKTSQQNKDENIDWTERLQNSKNVEDHSEVVSEVLSALSIGRDMASMFPAICRLATSKDLKLKKLVYLFLMNYHTLNPGTEIQVVSALEADAKDHEQALTRALAIRTMSYISSSKTIMAFGNSVGSCLTDTDPFVRKTAATAVAKLFLNFPDDIIGSTLIQGVKELLSDGNQVVVASAAAALVSISHRLTVTQLYSVFGVESDETLFSWDEVSALLTALQACTEWSALSILHAISNNGALPTNYDEADSVVQRLTNFLRHSNPAVSLTTVNLVLRYVYTQPPILNQQQCLNSLGLCVGPLVSLIGSSSAPEPAWIALRSIRLVASSFINSYNQNPFTKQIRILFCKYNDPLYIKLEKIELMSLLADSENCAEVAAELTEYARDVDPAFVRATIRALGAVAVRVPSAADLCVGHFVRLLTGQTEQEEGLEDGAQQTASKLPEYAAQELLIATQQIFRKYPERYEGIISTLAENITTLDDFNAKAALIWILGEYSARIEGVEEILADLVGLGSVLVLESEDAYNPRFKGTFVDENPIVQIQFLTACTKLFLNVPTVDTQRLLQHVLQLSTDKCDSPDVRQRGAFYWRLLGVDPSLQTARNIVFYHKPEPVFADDISDALRFKLAKNLGSASSVLREVITEQDEKLVGPEADAPNKLLSAVTDQPVEELDFEDVVTLPPGPALSGVGEPAAGTPGEHQAESSASGIFVTPTAEGAEAKAPVMGLPGASAAPAPPQPKVNFAAFAGGPGKRQQKSLLGGDAPPKAAPPPAAAPAPAPVATPSPAPPPAPAPEPTPPPAPAPAPAPVDALDDLLGGGLPTPAAPKPAKEPPIVSIPPQTVPGNYFDPTYPFATVLKAPIRSADAQSPLSMMASWTREHQSPVMLVTFWNKGTMPLMTPTITFEPNAFGLKADLTAVANVIVPVNGVSNSGKPLPIPFTVTPDPATPFGAQQVAQPDPQCQSGFNILSFAMTFRNAPGQTFQFQAKVPLHALAVEASQYHDPATRLLSNEQAATASFDQNWAIVPDTQAAREALYCSFQQLGITAIADAKRAIVGKLFRGNLNYIHVGDNEASFLMNVQMAAFQQPLPVLVKVFWKAAAAPGVDTMIMIKTPPVGIITTAYTMQSVKFLLSK